MLKKLFILAAILSLASCGGKQKPSTTEQDNFKIEDEALKDPAKQGSYQTVDNEQQANALNAETLAAEQEVEVQDRVFFGYDSSEISDEAQKILDVQASWLKSDSNIKVTIEGHCDEKGTREYNIALGEKRANATKRYLVKHGVESSRIKVVSYGKERPAYFGSDEAVISKNRRSVTVVN